MRRPLGHCLQKTSFICALVRKLGLSLPVCGQLTFEHLIASAHRGHGHCIAKGAGLEAELMGKAAGYCAAAVPRTLPILPRAIWVPRKHPHHCRWRSGSEDAEQTQCRRVSSVTVSPTRGLPGICLMFPPPCRMRFHHRTGVICRIASIICRNCRQSICASLCCEQLPAPVWAQGVVFQMCSAAAAVIAATATVIAAAAAPTAAAAAPDDDQKDDNPAAVPAATAAVVTTHIASSYEIEM